MIMHFRSFRLQPPHAPPSSGNASCSGRAWPPIRFVSLSAVLRTSHFSSCLISRIRPYRVCVATLHWAAVLRTIRSLPVALHPVSPRRSYFQFLAGSSATEGLSPSCARSLSSAPKRLAEPPPCKVEILQPLTGTVRATFPRPADGRSVPLSRGPSETRHPEPLTGTVLPSPICVSRRHRRFQSLSKSFLDIHRSNPKNPLSAQRHLLWTRYGYCSPA